MIDKFMLTDRIEARYNTEHDAYEALPPYKGNLVILSCYACEANVDTLEALKYTFNKLYPDLEAYDKQARKNFFNKIYRSLDQGCIDMPVPEEIDNQFILLKVDIKDVNRVGFTKSANTQVVFHYIENNIFHLLQGKSLVEFKMAGTLEDGLTDLYVDGQIIDNNALDEVYKYLVGDDIDESELFETYYDDIELMGKDVKCCLKISNNASSRESALKLMEKVCERDVEYDDQARELILSSLIRHISEFEKTTGEKIESVDCLKSALTLEKVLFSINDHFEFSYRFYGSSKDLVAVVAGTSCLGFLTYAIEYVDSEVY